MNTAFVPVAASAPASGVRAASSCRVASARSRFASPTPAARALQPAAAAASPPCATTARPMRMVASQRAASLKTSTPDARVRDGMRLHEFLALQPNEKLATAVDAMAMACKVIGYDVRTASCDKESCVNVFGDQQLAVDLLADKTIETAMRKSGVVATGSSEEQPVENAFGGDSYAVAWDPLDGSSIVDTNFSVGTIFGMWPGSRLTGITGRELVAAGMAVYGPRTSITLAVDGIPGAHEFLLVDNFTAEHGMWVLVQSFHTVDEGKLFAPGNLRGTQDNPGYAELFDYWMKNKYQLRYTGGMVPDANQILIKGKGVFANPASPSAPPKLRVLYEVAPIGFLIEKGGGASSDGEKSVLDIEIDSTEACSQVCYGSAGEVARFNELVGKKYLRG